MPLEDWQQLKLGDVVELKRGYDLPKALRKPGSVPIISSSGHSGSHSEAKAEGPGVVTGRYGTIGEVYKVGEDYWPLNTTLYVRDFKGNDTSFVYYFLKTIDYRSYSDKAAVPGVNRNHLHTAEVVLPPLEEQKAIAHILGALDDKIELNRQMNETLEALAQAVFKSWFVDFDPVVAKADGRQPYGMSAEVAALFPDEFEASELGEVPRGWSVGTINDLCQKIESGGTPARKTPHFWCDGTIHWFKTGELSDGPLLESEELISETGLAGSSAKLWEPGTVLFALYASPTLGRLGILEVKGTSNQACAGLLVKPEYGLQFLVHTLLKSREELQRIAAGAAQQNINQRILKEHQVVVASPKTASEFSKNVSNLYQQTVENIRENSVLSQIRDSLLPKLLSGELRVGQAEKVVEGAL